MSFVDVTSMSDIEIKRLGQQDEPSMPMKRERKVRPQPKMFDTDMVFAAAAAAYRTLGNRYIKLGHLEEDEEGILKPKRSNREFMIDALTDPTMITDEDREMGATIRTYYKGLMFKILGGKVLSEFDSKALALANAENLSERDIGVLAYLPAGYGMYVRTQSVEDKIADASGGYVGKIGEKHNFNAEVVRCVHSIQWGCFFITAITEQNQPVFFSHAREISAGAKISAQGVVKAHHSDGKTQFNRVKIVG